jgi:hypothetical protein
MAKLKCKRGRTAPTLCADVRRFSQLNNADKIFGTHRVNRDYWNISALRLADQANAVFGDLYASSWPSIRSLRKFTAILLVMMSLGRFSGYVFGRRFSLRRRRPDFLQLVHGPRKGPLFYLWLSINCGMELMTLFAGPSALYPPWSRTVKEPRGVCGSFILANGSASHRISVIDALVPRLLCHAVGRLGA